MTDSMSAAAILEIERLVRAADGKTVELGDRKYATAPLHDPRRSEPVPETLVVSTLESLVGYLTSDHDEDYRDGRGDTLVHIVSPTEVRAYTDVFGEFNQRVCLAKAQAITPRIRLEEFLDPEVFNIQLAVHFVDTPARADVLRLTGNLAVTESVKVTDDGISQEATARKGIERLATVSVPNPVRLAPRRTFTEIVQPESAFVLRLAGGGDGRPPKCALFDASIGAWELDAIAKIRGYLNTELAQGGDNPFDIIG